MLLLRMSHIVDECLQTRILKDLPWRMKVSSRNRTLSHSIGAALWCHSDLQYISRRCWQPELVFPGPFLACVQLSAASPLTGMFAVPMIAR